MSDLAKAAASGVLVDLGGKKLEVRPLSASDLGALELQALHNYKRRCIKTYTDNLDLIADPKVRESIAASAFDKASKLDLDGMPTKEMDVPINGVIQKMYVPYAGWWMSGTFEGMLCTVWYSAKKANPALKFEEVTALIDAAGQDALRRVVDVIDGLTVPPPGNSPAPLLDAEAAAKIEAK